MRVERRDNVDKKLMRGRGRRERAAWYCLAMRLAVVERGRAMRLAVAERGRDSGIDEVRGVTSGQVEGLVGKAQEKALGKGMGELDAANSQGAMDKLRGGDSAETLFGKVFIGINFLQVRSEMSMR